MHVLMETCTIAELTFRALIMWRLLFCTLTCTLQACLVKSSSSKQIKTENAQTSSTGKVRCEARDSTGRQRSRNTAAAEWFPTRPVRANRLPRKNSNLHQNWLNCAEILSKVSPRRNQSIPRKKYTKWLSLSHEFQKIEINLRKGEFFGEI